MQQSTHDLMLDQVRAIYKAVTGTELPENESDATWHDGEDLVAARFAELEATVRVMPTVAARVPPFAFMPLVDILERKPELIIEASLPGVTRESVEVRILGDALLLEGAREWSVGANGQACRYAEIPRGPFRRVVWLPATVSQESPHIELKNGILRVHLNKITSGAVAKA